MARIEARHSKVLADWAHIQNARCKRSLSWIVILIHVYIEDMLTTIFQLGRSEAAICRLLRPS